MRFPIKVVILLWMLISTPALRAAESGGTIGSESRVRPALEFALEAANEVIRRESGGDNVGASSQAHLVYHAATLLLAAGREAEAGKLLQAAVRLAPHQIEWQWQLAQWYHRNGSEERGKSLAQLVWERAESEELLKASAAYLGLKPDWKVPPFEESRERQEVVVLIPLGTVDDWLLHSAAESLEKKLGMPTKLVRSKIDLGEPDRTRGRWVAKEADGLLKWELPIVRATMKELGIASRESASERQVLQLLATLMMAAGRKSQAIDWLNAYATESSSPQWNADRLMNAIASSDQRLSSPWVRASIALTEADIYDGKSNFLFALQGTRPPLAIVSAARFKASFGNYAPDRSRLALRIEKQVLSSFGTVLGVPRCSDPRCVRAYPASLDEFDAKGSEYCADCRARIEQKLGRKLP